MLVDPNLVQKFSWHVYTHSAFSNSYINTNATPALPLPGQRLIPSGLGGKGVHKKPQKALFHKS